MAIPKIPEIVEGIVTLVGQCQVGLFSCLAFLFCCLLLPSSSFVALQPQINSPSSHLAAVVV